MQQSHYTERVADQSQEIERLGATAQRILNNVNHELRLSKFKKEKYFIDKYITSRHSQIEFATRIQRIYRRKLFVCIKKKWIKKLDG